MADRADIVVVGAGAAGLAAAIFAGRAVTGRRIIVLDGARKPGAKILVSGGSRCNVTNAIVTEADFNGGRRSIIRQILRSFPVDETIAFFREIGVPLHEEAGGKLFPDTNRSRDVLDALLRAVARAGCALQGGRRAIGLARTPDGFLVETSLGPLAARMVVLATGGLSLPKTGSDGAGYGFARALGHSIVPTTPALVPLVLEEAAVAAELSGVSHPATLDVRAAGARASSATGSLLWTHFGISGPVTLDISRHWLRARLEGRAVDLAARLIPEETFESLDALLTGLAGERGRASVERILAQRLPVAVSRMVLSAVDLPRDLPLAQLARPQRRRLIKSLLEWRLPARDSRGYNYAEVTAGGVALTEIDPKTMQSRVCPGLFLVGEILDVDGRIGGFNFQWAWASARVAARALARS